MHYLRSYIKGCHICQLAHNEKPPVMQLQTRINPNYIPLSRLSMDLKVMPRSHKRHKFILCIIDEVTNYLINCSHIPSQVRRDRRSTYRKCYNEILHSRIYNHGSRQCIYVFTHDLIY